MNMHITYILLLLSSFCSMNSMEEISSTKPGTMVLKFKNKDELSVDLQTLNILKESITLKNMLEDLGETSVIDLSNYKKDEIIYLLNYLEQIHAINHAPNKSTKEKLYAELQQRLSRISLPGLEALINLSELFEVPLLQQLLLTTLIDDNTLKTFIKTGYYPEFNVNITKTLAQQLTTYHPVGNEFLSWFAQTYGILHKQSTPIHTFSLDTTGKIIASAYRNIISFWELVPPAIKYCCSQERMYDINTLLFHPAQKMIAVGLAHTIELYNLDTDQTIQLRDHTQNITSLAWASPTILVSSSHDKTIKIWDINKKEIINIFEEHTGKIFTVAASPQKQLIASAGSDKVIKIWDLNNKKSLYSLSGHAGPIYMVAFHPKEPVLASTSADKTCKLWSVGNSNLIATLNGHTKEVTCVAFSSDGKYIATGSEDKTTKIWDYSTKSLLCTISVDSSVNTIAFTSSQLVIGTTKQLLLLNQKAIDQQREALKEMPLKTLLVLAAAYNAYQEDNPLQITNNELANYISLLPDNVYEFLTKELKITIPLRFKFKHYLKGKTK